MKHFLIASLIAVASLGQAQAHGGAEAKHGGTVQMASDLSFELVAGEQDTALYIEDHGKPLALAGISGKLTVLAQGKSSEAALSVAGDRLLAAIRVGKGAKVVASLVLPGGKPVSVRFSIR